MRKITLGCWNYDRTSAIADGRVKPQGIEVEYVSSWLEDSVERILRGELDAAEFSLSTYVVTFFRKSPPIIAIPVFPSRMFRHRSIYVNTQSKITKPKDLIGKKIGIPRYKQTAGVWMRGIMSDEYGVPVTSPTYIQCGQEKPEVEWERFAMSPEESKSFSPEIKLQFITDKTHTLSNMLATGEVDASYSAHAPSTLYSQPKKVRLLFEDYVTEEKNYFKKTGIFPLMHVIVIKKDVYDSNPRIASSLYDAFDEAKKLTLIDMNEAAATASILPWQIHHYAETTEIMGTDYYAYGLKANRKTLETFLRYSYEQGLARRLLKPEELFAAETLDT